MAPLTQNGESVRRRDPNAILNECRDIDRGIDGIERMRLVRDDIATRVQQLHTTLTTSTS